MRKDALSFPQHRMVAAMATEPRGDAPFNDVLTPDQWDNLRTVGAALGEDRGWLVWGPLLDRHDKPKPPARIVNGKTVASGWNKPELTHSLDEALSLVGSYPHGADGRQVLGIGFEINCAEDDRIVVLDFDGGVVKDGQPGNETGREVFKRFSGTYGEISGSKDGTRIVCRAGSDGHGWAGSTSKIPLPGGGSVEFYAPGNSAAKFFRMTGNRAEGFAAEVTEQPEALAWVVGLMKDAREGAGGGHPATPPAGEPPANPATPAASQTVPTERAPGQTWGELADELLARLRAMKLRRRTGWAAEAKEPEAALKALQTLAGSKPDSELAKLMRGEWQNNEADLFTCAEAIRRGARTLDDVHWVWEGTPAWRPDKVRNREDDYVHRTIAKAAGKVLEEALKKANPRQGAIDAVAAAAQAAGDALKMTAEGTRATASLGNVVAILRHDAEYAGCVRFNQFTEETERVRSWRVFDKGATDQPGELDDDDLSRARIGLERKYGIVVDKAMVDDALETVARDNSYHPVRQRLLECHATWDGKPRLHQFLKTHARAAGSWNGHDLSEYLETVGTLMMVGIVARAFKPGCKLDSQITLVGPDGARKSSFWEALANSIGPNLFTDSVPDLDGDPVKLYEATRGVLIVEIAEGAAIRKSELQKSKAALNSKGSKHRTAFSRKPVMRLRHFALVSTANDMEFLPNGDAALRRRFWPVVTKADKLNPLDLDALAAEADQLWGEAVALYLEMSSDGTREPAIFICPDKRPKAYAGWQLLLGEVTDEAGPYGDILQDLNRRWHGSEAVSNVHRKWPADVGCPTRELAELIGYGGDKLSPSDARQVAGWARAAGLVGKPDRNGVMRWWPSLIPPERFDD